MADAAEKLGFKGLVETALLNWHLCSLDAPTIAYVWAAALARLAEVRLTAAEACVLGLGTWIVYVVDRLLDGAAGGPSADHLRERHHFHSRHRRLLLWLCCMAGAGLIALCKLLAAPLVEFYLLLGLPVAAYGLRVHRGLLWPGRVAQHRPSRGPGLRKEAAVAVLFTAAVAAPALIRTEPVHRPALLVVSLLLALLCWFNCALISHAEAPRRDCTAQRHREGRLLAASAIALSGAAAFVLLWAPGHASQSLLMAGTVVLWNPSAAVLLSCLLLLTLLLAFGKSGAQVLRLRILADVGLLTPLLLLLPHAR